MIVLVTGGARAGKSRYALARAQALGVGRPGIRLFVATAEPGDDEMRHRIARHQAERGPGWRTEERPRDPQAALAGPAPPAVAVVDCLTLWVSNLVLSGRTDDEVLAAADALVALAAAAGQPPIVLVTNEVGWGIVPEHPLARRFRDLLGAVNQRVADRAEEIVLVVAGQPLRVR